MKSAARRVPPRAAASHLRCGTSSAARRVPPRAAASHLRCGTSSAARRVPPRAPAVAGIFCPERKETLKELLERIVPPARKKQKAVAAIVPHGSLFSSGRVAGAVYGRLEPSSTALILGPNHSGIGERASIAAEGEWDTPLGRVPVDRELARAILKHAPDLKKDPKAHQYEHAAEVQLPFLQRFWDLRSFVPVALARTDLETVRRLGAGLAAALKKSSRAPFLIGSSNLACWDPPDRAGSMDRQIIERILALDEEGLLEQSARADGPICGASAVAATLAAAKGLGASRGSLVKYEAGYAGILVE